MEIKKAKIETFSFQICQFCGSSKHLTSKHNSYSCSKCCFSFSNPLFVRDDPFKHCPICFEEDFENAIAFPCCLQTICCKCFTELSKKSCPFCTKKFEKYKVIGDNIIIGREVEFKISRESLSLLKELITIYKYKYSKKKFLVNMYDKLLFHQEVLDLIPHYLVWLSIAKKGLTPGDKIDKMWHLHILQTENYSRFCKINFNRFIPHYVSQMMDSDTEVFYKKVKTFMKLDGKIPREDIYKFWIREGEFNQEIEYIKSVKNPVFIKNIMMQYYIFEYDGEMKVKDLLKKFSKDCGAPRDQIKLIWHKTSLDTRSDSKLNSLGIVPSSTIYSVLRLSGC